jgi:hypothetical protein
MKKSKKTTKKRSFFDLTYEEREREVARFDKPIDIERETRPLTARERARWNRIMAAKTYESVYIHGGQVDRHIHVDEDLVEQLKVFGKKKRMSLAQVVDRGLRGLLAFGE